MITPEQLAWLVIVAASFAAGAVVVALYGHYRREAAEDCPIPGCARWWPREEVEGREVHRATDVTGLLDTLEAPWLALGHIPAAGTEERPTDTTGAEPRYRVESIDPNEPPAYWTSRELLDAIDRGEQEKADGEMFPAAVFNQSIVDQLRERAFDRAEAAERRRQYFESRQFDEATRRFHRTEEL